MLLYSKTTGDAGIFSEFSRVFYKPNHHALHRELLTTVKLLMEDVSRMLTSHLRHFQQQTRLAHPTPFQRTSETKGWMAKSESL